MAVPDARCHLMDSQQPCLEPVNPGNPPLRRLGPLEKGIQKVVPDDTTQPEGRMTASIDLWAHEIRKLRTKGESVSPSTGTQHMDLVPSNLI